MSALTFLTAQALRALPRRRVSRAVGRLADHAWHPWVGGAVVNLYARLYDVRFDDCRDAGGWPSFDAFFTRELRSGARPIDPEARAVVSPADGRIDSFGRIDRDLAFRIKGETYKTGDLVGDPSDAERYVGGGACVVYLSPRDYHRVHAPASGVVSIVRSMPGDYFPVNGVGTGHIKRLFARNRRVSIAIDTPAFGRITVVMVAALIVGRITMNAIDARDVPHGVHTIHRPIERGAEIGVFHLGSTVVLFLESRALEEWTVRDGPVRCGQTIARAPAGGGRS